MRGRCTETQRAPTESSERSERIVGEDVYEHLGKRSAQNTQDLRR